MTPRNLPSLTADAVRGGWDVLTERNYYRGVRALFAQFDNGPDVVLCIWEAETGRLITSEINGTATPYAQCARLIRSDVDQ